MAGGAHEEEHGEGQPERGARGEIVPTHQPLGFRRHRHTLFSSGTRPGDETLLHPPDDSTSVKKRDETKTFAHANSQFSVRNISPAIQREHKPGRCHYYYGNSKH